MAKIFYLTQDGITDHIGQSQIAPYLVGLARIGHRIHILSAEKPGRAELIARYRALFDEAGISWTTVRYANRPPLVSSLLTMVLMWRAANRIAGTERPDIVHCRSYLPLEIAARLKRRFGIHYLADFRDFWADVGMETKRFKSVYRMFRKREPTALGPADHVVTLTERAAKLLISRHPQVVAGDRANYTVIPCCADFELFDPVSVSAEQVELRREQLAIPADAPVLLYLGSLGPDYLLKEMMALFRELLGLHSNAIFLILANNGHDLVYREAAAAGVPKQGLRCTAIDRSDVPEHIAIADLSVVFIRPTESKAGCSPTKLGELFAMNVPIIANSGFGDIDEIVSLETNGSVVVTDFAPETLREALRAVIAQRDCGGRSIRSASGNFSLDEGVRRYDSIYCRLSSDKAQTESGTSETC